jgi:uncharacterized protein RhaS with RHS repeats
MATSNGRYDINRDPLWNGQAEGPTGPGFSKEEVACYQVDHLGTPQELTDHEGNVAWAAQYKAWGQAKEVISEAARQAGISNPIRFQGQYFDEETGCTTTGTAITIPRLGDSYQVIRLVCWADRIFISMPPTLSNGSIHWG